MDMVVMQKIDPKAMALLCFALLSCAPNRLSQEPEQQPGTTVRHGPSASSPTPVRGIDGIKGEWDIVSFEGYRPERLTGTVRAAFADFSESGVRLRIECNYSGRAGTVENGRFLPSNADPAPQTEMGCGPEREARDSRLFSFFEKSPTVEQAGVDRIRMRAGGGELVLERPSIHRLKFAPSPIEMQGVWRMVELTHYLPQGGYSGGGLSEVPGRIVISGERIIYNRCPQFGVQFRFGEAGRLIKISGAELPASPSGCGKLSEQAAAPDPPALWEILRLIHANPAVEKTGTDSLVLSTDRLALLLTKAPCESVEQSNDHLTTTVRDCASPE